MKVSVFCFPKVSKTRFRKRLENKKTSLAKASFIDSFSQGITEGNPLNLHFL